MRLTAGAGFVWATDIGNSTPPDPKRVPAVTRINPSEVAIVGGPIPVGQNPSAIAFGDDAIFVTNAGDNTVTRIQSSASR
jgi:DNA-binding beta-propeller fold protein YncE